MAEDLGQFAISGWDAKDNQDKQEEIQLVAMLQDYIRAAKAEIVDIRKALDQCALKVGQ